MPHAENHSMGEHLVNGEQRQSQFFSHLISYPMVSDTIETFKKNKYGAKSLGYADQGYERFAKPVLPYLSKPYGYVAPYIAKADSFGDQGLNKVDETFPIVKEDTQKIRGTIVETAYLPLRLVTSTRQHVFEMYGSEYKKCGGDGMVASGKAVITTSLLLTQESLTWLSAFWASKKQQTKEVIHDKMGS